MRWSGRFTDKVYDTEERWVRDLPILGAQTHLLVERRRVSCPFCGPTRLSVSLVPLPVP